VRSEDRPKPNGRGEVKAHFFRGSEFPGKIEASRQGHNGV
jgi:hypothetical protein